MEEVKWNKNAKMLRKEVGEMITEKFQERDQKMDKGKYKDEDKPVPMHKVWDAYATDMITQYSFGFNYGHMESDGFNKSFHDAFMAVSEFGHIALQMPWITPVSSSIKVGAFEQANRFLR